jgi:hypothetical protein
VKIIHIDRSWNLSRGTPTQHFADYYCEKTGKTVEGRGPANDRFSELLRGERRIGIIPPWRGVQAPKHFGLLRDIVHEAVGLNLLITLFADDLHQLEWSFETFRQEGALNRTLCVTNFGRIESTGWPTSCNAFWPIYPFHRLNVQVPAPTPSFEFGYVGRFNSRRMTILKKCAPKDLVLLGPQWYNQTIFHHAFTEGGGKRWIDVPQLFQAVKWNISVQDFKQQDMKPRISRFGECYASGRPMLFHTSHVEALPEVPWPRELVWTTADDVHRIVRDVKEQEAVALLGKFCEEYYR